MSARLRVLHVLASVLMLAFSSQAAAGGVLVFGDSLSAAYGVPAGKGWVDLLAVRVHEYARDRGGRYVDAEGKPLVVVNASVSGETTQGGITRIGDALARHRPQVLILELGGNDALRGLLLNRTKDNLAQMIMQARASGAKVLLFGMQAPPNLGPAFTQRFAALYRELHEELKVAWVPFFFQGVALNPQLMQRDGLHPTTQAQPQLLDNVWPALQAVLEEGA